MTQSLGTLLPTLLKARGIDIVFGIPGVHTVEMYRGLPESGLRHVTPRHEQAAGFMADGHARASGRVAACFVITGPGLTNILTAMGQAYQDSVPMLVISTVNARGRIGTGEGWLHELPDQSRMAAGVAAFSRRIMAVEELEPALDAAFAVFASARPRPVHIEIPVDLLTEPLVPRTALPELPAPPVAAAGGLDRAAAFLDAARRPVILAGGGARRADVAALAGILDAPVVMTANGRGLLPAGHALAVPLSPMLAGVRALVAEADVVLAVGTELGHTDYDFDVDGGFRITGRLLRVDIDPEQITRNAAGLDPLPLVGDAAGIVAGLCARLAPREGQGAARAAAARACAGTLSAAMQGDLRLLAAIRDRLPDAPIVGDSTQIVYSGNLAHAALAPGRWFNAATGFGTLGYGLPAAIGAALALDGPAVAISGDGGLQFCLAELASAAEAGAKVILILHDNRGYGEIRSYMRARAIPEIGVDILTPDLCAIARACGWQVFDAAEGVAPALEAAIAAEGPAMIYLDEAARGRL